MAEYRLGDLIDDFCAKCKRITNHDVVSMLGAEVAKVRCRTCYFEHDYRHEQPPVKLVDPKKQALFEEVLAKVSPSKTPAIPPSPVPDPPRRKPRSQAPG